MLIEKPANIIETRVNDIFINGNDYSTECATAIMIVYYKGLLNVYRDDLFNRLFPRTYLMDWDVTELLLQEVANPQISSDILLVWTNVNENLKTEKSPL